MSKRCHRSILFDPLKYAYLPRCRKSRTNQNSYPKPFYQSFGTSGPHYYHTTLVNQAATCPGISQNNLDHFKRTPKLSSGFSMPNTMHTSELNDAGKEGPQGYQFPRTKLKTPKDPSKIPIALIACGSFSPVKFQLSVE